MQDEIGIWRELEREQLDDCRVFTVHRSTRESPVDQSHHDFYLIDSSDWVNIVPLTDDNQVVCIRQFRHGTERIELEVPGGLVDPGEDAQNAAARECLEETGFEVQDLQSLGKLSPNPALFPNRLHTFVGYHAVKTAEIVNTEREHTSVELFPVSRLPELLVSGQIEHALVVATLWRFLYFNRDLF